MNEEENKKLDEAANGEASENNPAEAAQQQAMTARQKALERVRGRNAERNFADDDDEALYGAMNEDADADAEELGNYRRNSDELNNFLRDNPRGAGLLNAMRKDGNPIGYFVEQYGEDMLRSLDDPQVKESIVKAEKSRLEQLAKDKEAEEEAKSNLEKSRQVRQAMIDEGYDEAQVDEAIKSIIDRAVRNLMSDISREDIEGVINLGNRDKDMAAAESRGEVRGRNANIGQELSKRRKASDGIPALSNSSQVQPKKEDNTGALGQIANRRPML